MHDKSFNLYAIRFIAVKSFSFLAKIKTFFLNYLLSLTYFILSLYLYLLHFLFYLCNLIHLIQSFLISVLKRNVSATMKQINEGSSIFSSDETCVINYLIATTPSVPHNLSPFNPTRVLRNVIECELKKVSGM